MSSLRRRGSSSAGSTSYTQIAPAADSGSSSEQPRSRWSYYTLAAITRTKSTAQVLHEAAEEEAEANGAAEAAAAAADAGAPAAAAGSGGMAKVLTVWDVIAYGIGSTLGAGIFAITGSGAHAAGPAVVLSFCVAAVACLFSAFSYMEFAARVPIAGSAYTFVYVCMGELAAWFVGWNLTLEYAISAAVVARTWSRNLELFTNKLCEQTGYGKYPSWLSDVAVHWGVINDLSPMSAVICLICMGILLLGVKESSNFNMFITVLNISVITFIIILGSFHITPSNWTSPRNGDPAHEATFFPTGGNGILTGAATVFFSYIGFDAVTTLSEEVKNPKRDVPIGIIVTLVGSTIMYVGTSVVILGMQPWWALDIYTPLALAFDHVGVGWASLLISGATVTALTGNTLTSLFGQPRIFYRMAKDGLLFKQFATLHPTTKVPLWGTIYTGVGAALIALFIPLDSLANMISIGTLLAFSTVCAGVVILRYEPAVTAVGSGDQQRLLSSVVSESPSGCDQPQAVNGDSSSIYSPLAGSANFGATTSYNSSNEGVNFGSSSAAADALSPVRSLWARLKVRATFWLAIYLLPCIGFCAALRHTATAPLWLIIILGLLCLPPVFILSRLPVCAANLPSNGNFTCPFVPWLPCAGIFTNVYLVTSLDVFSYVRIVCWTAIGFAIYFLYGITHSTLREKLARYERIMHADRQAQEAASAALSGPSPSQGGRFADQQLGSEFSGRESRTASSAEGLYTPPAL